MSDCNSDACIAGDHTHTDIITRNIEEPQQCFILVMVSNRLLGGKGGLHMIILALRFCSGPKLLKLISGIPTAAGL